MNTDIALHDVGQADIASVAQITDWPETKKINRPVKILFIKPYQDVVMLVHSPPLGILYLIANLRETLGKDVEVKMVDLKLDMELPEAAVHDLLREFDADIVGVSALNCEARSSKEIAALCKSYNENIITVLGGPYAHNRAEEILAITEYDWLFNGPADRTFCEAVKRHIYGLDMDGVPGMSFKRDDGELVINEALDIFKELDDLPLPAWDMIDFEAYKSRNNMIGMMKGKRYASIFTSRGCPYLCHYCHDVFSKKFTWRSAENVLSEIELLYEKYGVDEFQIVDDIFNLHKPRVKQIMREVERRWPGKLHFCFPNGVRADILDDDVLDDLKAGGTYALSIAIESATPRLQHLVEKNLDIDRALWAINAADKRGMYTQGFFMLGFPTETEEEMQATVNFALESRLTRAMFFQVIPQPETPLHDLAKEIDEEALSVTFVNEEESGDIFGQHSWYQLATGFPLDEYIYKSTSKFYYSPRRILRHFMRVPHPFRHFFTAVYRFLTVYHRLRKPLDNGPDKDNKQGALQTG